MSNNIRINLTEAEAEVLVSSMESLSDRLTKQHADSHSGTEQFVLISAIQEVDRLVQNIKEQVHFEKESLPA
jgi:hypothetical protein